MWLLIHAEIKLNHGSKGALVFSTDLCGISIQSVEDNYVMKIRLNQLAQYL